MGIELSPTHLNVQATRIDLKKFAVIRFRVLGPRFSTREPRFKGLENRYKGSPFARIGLRGAQQARRLLLSGD